MNELLLAERYAQALSASVEDDADLESIRDDLAQGAELFDGNAELKAFALNPAVPLAVREDVVEEILAAAGESETTRRFVATPMERGRISLLPLALKRFVAIVDERLNRVSAKVTSAAPLTKDQEKRIREGLAKYCGKSVLMEVDMDPEIIGGVVVEVGGKILDGSVRTRLARLRESILAEET